MRSGLMTGISTAVVSLSAALAGAILAGTEIGKIFIENGRHHAGTIASAIARRLAPQAAERER